MLLKLYAVRDAKSDIYNHPMAMKTHGEAERTFKELSRDHQSMIHKYPEDYDLYYIGDYDDNNGKLNPLDTPQHMIKAVQLAESTKQA